MSASPLWGSKCWRLLTIIIAILLLAWGIMTMVTDYLAGYQLWWYSSTIVVYALALFGLVLLVKEGLDAFNNAAKYGVRPEKSEWERQESTPSSLDEQLDNIRTYDEPD